MARAEFYQEEPPIAVGRTIEWGAAVEDCKSLIEAMGRGFKPLLAFLKRLPFGEVSQMGCSEFDDIPSEKRTFDDTQSRSPRCMGDEMVRNLWG
jgi:hypothetical protein